MEKFLTAEEVREGLSVSEPTLWRWRRDGKIKAFRLPYGRMLRFRERDVLKVLEEEAVAA